MKRIVITTTMALVMVMLAGVAQLYKINIVENVKLGRDERGEQDA